MVDDDPHALDDLLNSAYLVFHTAGKLGEAFQAERRNGNGQVDSQAWNQHAGTFHMLSLRILDLREVIQSPPLGFENVAKVLRTAGATVVRIRDCMNTEQGRTFAEYRDHYPELNSIGADGFKAIQEARKELQNADPFDFVKESPKTNDETQIEAMTLDELAVELTRVDQQMNSDRKRYGVSGFGFNAPNGVAREKWQKAYNAHYDKRQAIQARIDAIIAREKAELLKSLPPFDTTPLVPEPPSVYVDAALRHIPELMANVAATPNGVVELLAATLAQQLQEMGHRLAAAEWAIFRAIRAGELRAVLLVWGGLISAGPDGRVRRNSFVTSAGSSVTSDTKMAFDKFNVEATDRLWQRWHEITTESNGKLSEGGAGQKQASTLPTMGAEPALGMNDSTGTKEHQANGQVEIDIDELDRTTPKLELKSGNWLLVGSKAFHEVCFVQANSLNTRRKGGRKATSGIFGRDEQGRIWRKQSRKSRKVYYWKPSLEAASLL